jgi:hypothetical protein
MVVNKYFYVRLNTTFIKHCVALMIFNSQLQYKLLSQLHEYGQNATNIRWSPRTRSHYSSECKLLSLLIFFRSITSCFARIEVRFAFLAKLGLAPFCIIYQFDRLIFLGTLKNIGLYIQIVSLCSPLLLKTLFFKKCF